MVHELWFGLVHSDFGDPGNCLPYQRDGLILGGELAGPGGNSDNPHGAKEYDGGGEAFVSHEWSPAWGGRAAPDVPYRRAREIRAEASCSDRAKDRLIARINFDRDRVTTVQGSDTPLSHVRARGPRVCFSDKLFPWTC